MKLLKTKHLVVGSGIGGLSLALKLARHESVILLMKGRIEDTNSWYAQGGIASVLSTEDSFESHVRDTMDAGAGLCHENIVELVVEEGPKAISELIDLGVRFTQSQHDGASSNGYHLTKEGGHSKRRVIHAADATGREIITALFQRAQENSNIQIIFDSMVIDLLTTDRWAPTFSGNFCFGAYALNCETQEVFAIKAEQTYLCTGGHGKAYLYTSNPDSATGDGLAIAWRAGCKVANLEFMQFHPTCLYHLQARTFLISEAVRGEGGVLRDARGEEFMNAIHPLGSLAPRDIVARSIDLHMKKHGDSCVYLDTTKLSPTQLQEHFPNIYGILAGLGIDMARDQIPVVPAAHYSCGGVVSDEWGRTNIGNLFVVGEVACTGLHGANRLASNSLLETVVFADRVYQYVSTHRAEKFSVEEFKIPDWYSAPQTQEDELVVLSHNWDEIRRVMWNYVGIVRTEKRLNRAITRLSAIRNELDEYYWNTKVNKNILEVRNLALVSWLTVRCAMSRKESRGIHYMLDYPEMFSVAKDTILSS